MASPVRAALRVGLALIAIACAPATSLLAQPPAAFVGQRVVEVRFLVEGRPTDEDQLLRVLDTPVGAPLTAYGVRESIVHLMALRRFDDVQVSAEGAPGGVALTYALTPRQILTGVDFEGDLGLGAGRLRAALVERFSGTPPPERATDAAAGLQTLLQERGFREARVTPRIRSEGSTEATLVFDVAAGPRVRIGSLEVEGADRGQVTSRLGLDVGQPFDPAVVLDRIDRYLEELRGRGYHEARIEMSRSYSENGESANLVVGVELGPHITVVFRGDALPPEKRAEFLPLDREGGLDEDRLEDASIEIERYLRGQGYREATAPYTRERRADGEELLVFTVRRGPQYKVAEVVVEGNQQVPLSSITPLLTTAAGQPFVQSRLDGDLARLAEEYRRSGFGDVKVNATVAPRSSAEALLTVRFAIDEGPRVRVGDVSFAGNEALPRAELSAAVQSQPGTPFYRPQISADREAILGLYLSRGYQLASVDVEAAPASDGTRADLRFEVQEGPRVLLDRVIVVGNRRISPATIERESGLERGMPLSPQLLAEARRRLAVLGLFRRLQVSELQMGSGSERDVLIEVEEGPLNTIGYGGGLEGSRRLKRDAATGGAVEEFELAPRGFFEISRRNLWGRNRTVSLFTRAAIKSSDQVSSASADEPVLAPLEDDSSGFREYRVLGTYREPNFMGLPVDLAVSGVLDQAIRSSFDFNRRQAYVEGRHRFGRISVAGRYAFGLTRLFNDRIANEDRLNIDRLFNPGLRLSSFSGSVAHDSRDDSLQPTSGSLLLFDTAVAAQKFGSDVGFLRSYAQGFFFRDIPGGGGTVLAAGVRLGLARGFPRLVPDVDEAGEPVLGPDGKPVLVEVRDLPASERFFAGGDTTVRGFAQDRLGSSQVLDRAGVSRGGQAVLIFNGELRFPILRGIGLGGAAFADVGNVFARAADLHLGEMRASIGFGIRWSSPVGPLRVDLGWKLNPHVFRNGEREPGFAPHITIGQAF